RGRRRFRRTAWCGPEEYAEVAGEGEEVAVSGVRQGCFDTEAGGHGARRIGGDHRCEARTDRQGPETEEKKVAGDGAKGKGRIGRGYQPKPRLRLSAHRERKA